MKKIHPISLLFLICLSFLTILPLFQTGFFPIHDNTQVARVYEMKRALDDGFFPVRLVPDLGYGYGYPIFNYYAPLSYYIGAFFMYLGMPALIATKAMIAFAMLASGTSMYFLARIFVKSEGAVLAGILYAFSPYHAVNLYVRGAVSELTAYAFLPLAIYSLLRLSRDMSVLWVLVTGVCLAGVVLSHNLTALMLLPFYTAILLVLFITSFRQNRRQSLSLLLGPLLGVMLSAFYWLPAIVEMKYTNVGMLTMGGSVYADHFVCLTQLWFSQWGFGGSAPGCQDGLSFQIGKIHLVVGLISMITGIYFRKIRKVILLCMIGALVSIFMLLPISRQLWDILLPLHYLQFPWRFLQFVSLFLSLAGGIGLSYLLSEKLSGKKFQFVKYAIFLGIIVGIILVYTKNFQPQVALYNYPDQTGMHELRWTVSQISDEYLPASFAKPKSAKDVATGPFVDNGSVIQISMNKTQHLEATIQSVGKRNLVLNKVEFPAWKFWINDVLIAPKIENGRYVVTMPDGESRFKALLVSTTVEKVGNLISIVGFVGGVLGIIYTRKQGIYHAKTS